MVGELEAVNTGAVVDVAVVDIDLLVEVAVEAVEVELKPKVFCRRHLSTYAHNAVTMIGISVSIS